MAAVRATGVLRRWLIPAALYALAGILAQAVSGWTGTDVITWPMLAVATGVLMAGGLGLWPALLAGSVISALTVHAFTPWTLLAPAGHVSAAVLFRVLIDRALKGQLPSLRRIRDTSSLVVAGLAAGIVSSLAELVATVLHPTTGASDLLTTTLARMSGESVGAILGAAVVLASMQAGRRKADGLRLSASIAMSAMVVALMTIGFLAPWNWHGLTAPAIMLVVPIGIWGALRRGARTVTLSLVLVVTIASVGTVLGRGAFAVPERSLPQRDLLTFVFAFTCAVTALLVLATAGERADGSRREREMRRRFEVILDHSSDGLTLYSRDQDGVLRCVEMNDQTAAILFDGDRARARAAMIGRTRNELLPVIFSDPAAAERSSHFIDEVMATRETATETYTRTTPDGRALTFDTSYTPVFDEDDTLTHLVVSSRDITARTQALEALRVSEARLATVFDHVSDWLSLWSVDESGVTRLLSVNESQRVAMSGVASTFEVDAALSGEISEVLRRRVEACGVTGPKLDDLMQTHMHWHARALSTKQPLTYEEILSTGADQRIVEIEVIPVVDPSGRVTHVLRSSHDISERRRAEIAQQRLEASLRQSQKLEAIGTLAGGIAHDFNNILAGILGNVEAVRGDLGEQHPGQEGLDEVIRAVHRARDVVRQILTFSRREEARRRAVRVAPLVRETLRLLRASLPADVSLSSDVRDELATVVADEGQLHQVLMNLCTNAAHAVRGGAGSSISISERIVNVDATHRAMQFGASPGPYVCLSVVDDGTGMDARTLERVFEPFFTTKPPGEGTGLGLPVVHGIVRSHDGAILIDSVPGRGTRVDVLLPAAATAAKTSARKRTAAPKGNGERLMVVDDEPSIVQVAPRLLQPLGYKVSAFQQPAEALAVLRGDPGAFDLVISDLTMPGMSGLELAREIFQLRPELPVIVATGYANTSLPWRDGTSNVVEVISKPFDRSTVAEAIRTALDGARAAAGSAR